MLSFRLIAALVLTAAIAPSTASADTPWEAAFGKGVAKQKPGSKNPPAPPTTPPPPTVAKPTIPAAETVGVDRAQALTDAESLVATFNAAADAGATAFSTMRSTQQVVSALAAGVRGGGRYADTMFRVPGLDAARQAAVLPFLRIQRGRIVVGTPPASPSLPAAADPRTSFAGGRLKILVPDDFSAKENADGDLVMRTEGATMTVHLEAVAKGLNAWAEVRAAGDRAALPFSMSGQKVYVVEPNRRAPEKITVGFGQTLVTMTVEAGSTPAGTTHLRFALPAIIDSLVSTAE